MQNLGYQQQSHIPTHTTTPLRRRQKQRNRVHVSMLCSSDHFTSNNHMYLQPSHHRLLGTGVMEACDLESIGHEQSRHGQEAEEHWSDPIAALTTYLTFLEHKIGHLRRILCSTPCHPQQQCAIVSAELHCIIVQLVSITNDLASDSGIGADAADASPSEPSEERSPSLSNTTHDNSDDHAEAAGEEEEGEGPYEATDSGSELNEESHEILLGRLQAECFYSSAGPRSNFFTPLTDLGLRIDPV